MNGMNRDNGQPLSGLAHLEQSVADIITTPLNSRVMRRNYGCDLFQMIDAPMSGEFEIRAVASIYTALGQWEPRLIVQHVSVNTSNDGVLAIVLNGKITGTKQTFNQILNVML